MKVAVLLFGHLRTFEKCAPFMKKNVLDKYDCDVFVHTWDEMDSSTLAWDGKKQAPLVFSEKIKDKVNKLYGPKAFKVERQKKKDDEVVCSIIDGKKTSFNGMNFMFHSMNEANKLRKKYEKENNVKYDLVLATRPDVALYNKLELDKIVKEAKVLNLDLNNCRFFAGLHGNCDVNVRILLNRACDMLFFARPNVIDRYIKANSELTIDYVNKHFYNVVTVYASNEIKAGIFPVQICYSFGRDWRNIKFHQTEAKKKDKTKIYKFFHLYWLRGKK